MAGLREKPPPRRWRPTAARGAGAVVLWLRTSFSADNDRVFLWTPVLVGLGVASYFSLDFEPPLWSGLAGLLIAASALWAVRRRPALILLFAALFCVALGFAAAVLRAERVAAPVLERPESGALTARVISVERNDGGGLSAVLAPRTFARLPSATLPAKVRVNIRLHDAVLRPGAIVNLRVRLMPPPEPVQPGGFDFARQAWFEGLGAVGFAYTRPDEIEPPQDGAVTALAALRMAIGERIRSVIDGTSGAVAAALVNGERASIPDSVSEDLRAAGIFHVLSISGLHMVLFAGSLFWCVRAVLALSPHLALRYPIKKWAAVIALLGATFYLLISGAAIATQRAWIMISLMFIAILLDRPALSMRNVVLAAILILLWRPESLIGASFQMSFAAVVALVAFYESVPVGRWTSTSGRIALTALPRLALTYSLGIAFTSIVAGTATGAIAAYHFNRIALYGLAGNMAAMPIVGTLVMPMALLALLLMPFGLDGPALWLMGKGVEGMLAVAHEVASWQGADRLTVEPPLAIFVSIVLGGLWLALWRAPWRAAGLLPVLVGLLLWNSGTKPDVLVDRDAALFAARAADGGLVLTSSHPDYTARQWLRHDGDSRTPRQAAESQWMSCDIQGCVYREPERPVIAFPATLGAVVEDCRLADAVLAEIPVPYGIRKACGAGVVLDYFSFWRNGATSLTFDDGGGVVIASARNARGARPWVQRQTGNQSGNQ